MSEQLAQIKRLNQQAWELCKKDSLAALEVTRQVRELLSTCEQAGPVDEFECLKTQTYCLDMLSRPAEALVTGLRANQLAEQIGDAYLSGHIQSLVARIYWHIDDYAAAMDYYQRALTLVQNTNHPDLEVSLTNGLGLVQYGLENYTAALGYFMACLEMATESDLTGRADANNNIGYTLHMLGRDQEALAYDLQALALFDQLGTTVGKMETLHSLGAIYFALENYDQAMTYLQEGLALARQNNSHLLEISYIIEIARIHKAGHRLNLAEAELREALAIAEKINSLTNVSLAHERLAEVYKEKLDYRSALEHFEAFHAVFKKLFNDQSDRRVKNLEILHQVEATRKESDLYRQMSATDFLTNLSNIRSFLSMAEAALEKAKTENSPLAMIMLDVDHFKEVNDQYGHPAGDEVLSAVASRIKNSLRQGDIAGRYGGDEFIILVTGKNVIASQKIAERIRLAVCQHPVQVMPDAITVTASLGLVRFTPDRDASVNALIHYADQALYQAKERGRNQVVEWERNPG